MKNLVIKKFLVVPYILVSFSIFGSAMDANCVDGFEMASGFYVSNISVENNKNSMVDCPKVKRKSKHIF